MAPDPVSQFVVTYPVELAKVHALSWQPALEMVKVPSFVLHAAVGNPL
jgi:hypothetical protein